MILLEWRQLVKENVLYCVGLAHMTVSICHQIGVTWMIVTSTALFLCLHCYADDRFRFLYILILAMDANFRMSSRYRKNERDDPELGPGWAYFVYNLLYMEHLKNYVLEKDVSISLSLAC
jgi:hypothetical protein